MTVRQQLTLFVPQAYSAELEAVRRVVDPVQHWLIAAHVTLCREDELESSLGWRARLETMSFPSLRLCFDGVEAFMGHGLLLTCVGDLAPYSALREAVLGTLALRRPQPHLTLAHPRNPRAESNLPGATAALRPQVITFSTISLIEQLDGQPWVVLQHYPLAG
jgi:2'-5' RNA ligase superfamily